MPNCAVRRLFGKRIHASSYEDDCSPDEGSDNIVIWNGCVLTTHCQLLADFDAISA